jgi:riboflavin synthase
MFTGIVTDLGEVRSVKPQGGNLHRITIACGYPRAEVVQGASIACSGVCLTVVDAGEEKGGTWFAVDAADETLRVTTVRRWHEGTKVNLERPLKLATSSVGIWWRVTWTALATVAGREDMKEMARFVLRAPTELARFVAVKGSVAIDGVSSPSTPSKATRFRCSLSRTHCASRRLANCARAMTSISKSTPWPVTPRGWRR